MKVQNPKTFYKFGVTPDWDVMDRFKDLHNTYDVKVLFSVIMPRDKAIQHEQNILDKYQKNVYITEKIKGVTEIRDFDVPTKNGIIRELYALKAKWIKEIEKYSKYEKLKFYFVEITKK